MKSQTLEEYQAMCNRSKELLQEQEDRRNAAREKIEHRNMMRELSLDLEDEIFNYWWTSEFHSLSSKYLLVYQVGIAGPAHLFLQRAN